MSAYFFSGTTCSAHLRRSAKTSLASTVCVSAKELHPVWANFDYYWIMLRDSSHTRSWHDKAPGLVRLTGMAPTDISSRFPKQRYDLHRDFQRFDRPPARSLSVYVLVQFTVILVAHSHFLAVLPKQSPGLNVRYFLFLVLSLALLAGLLENRRVFQVLESARLLISAAIVLAMGGWFGNLRTTDSRTAIILFPLLSVGWLLATGWGVVTRKNAGLVPSRTSP